MISENDAKVFVWMDELCQEAQKDVILANRLGGNQAFAYYFANVYARKAVSQDMFAGMTSMAEARRWYGEYTEAEERKIAESARDEKINALEGKVDKLTELLTQFVESKEQPAKGKKAAKVEAPEEDEE